MRRGAIAVAAATLVLAACGADPDEPGDVGDAPDDDPDVIEDDDPDAIEDQDPPDVTEEDADPPDDMEEMGAATDMVGMEFEGFWHFQDVTEVAVFLDADADADAVADELSQEDGVAAVDEVDEAEVGDRAALDALRGPDAPAPRVLLVTGDDHEAATDLAAVEDRDDVLHAFAPTCDGLAGTARLHGVDEARALFDEAGCAEPVILDADPDGTPPWVAVAGVEDDAVCAATAVADGPMVMGATTCSEDGDDPSNPVVAMAGGLVVGFPPDGTETVELDYRDETLAAEPVDVDDTVASFAVQLTDGAAEDAGDAPVAEAPDIGEIDWRFLDDDGTVLDEG